MLEGARADAFISADAAQMDVAERAGRLVKGSRVDLLTNQLVVGRGSRLDAAGQRAASLGAAAVRRVALGNPDSVPAGVYARQWLEKAGAWPPVSGKVVPTVTVRAALAAVRSGRADLAVVYHDRRPHRADRAGALHRAARRRAAGAYPAAVVEGPNQAAAQRFLDYLRGAEAGAVFTTAGFGLAGR